MEEISQVLRSAFRQLSWQLLRQLSRQQREECAVRGNERNGAWKADHWNESWMNVGKTSKPEGVARRPTERNFEKQSDRLLRESETGSLNDRVPRRARWEDTPKSTLLNFRREERSAQRQTGRLGLGSVIPGGDPFRIFMRTALEAPPRVSLKL